MARDELVVHKNPTVIVNTHGWDEEMLLAVERMTLHHTASTGEGTGCAQE